MSPAVLRQAARWGGLAAVVLVVLAAAAVGIGPRTGRYRTLTVLSGSMAPAIPRGSMVVVVPVEPSRLRVGDVLTYRIPVDDRRVVSHRVVKIVEGGPRPVVVTKGDASPSADPWMSRIETDQAWRVRAVVPLAGHLVHAMRQPGLRQGLVLGLPLVLAAVWLAEIWRPNRQPAAVDQAGRALAPARPAMAPAFTTAALLVAGAVITIHRRRARTA